MKKINLAVVDRIYFPAILPQQGKTIEMMSVKLMAERVRFTPEEIEEYELKDNANGSVRWNQGKAREREFRFEDSEIEIIFKGAEILDVQERMTVPILKVLEKFPKPRKVKQLK
jgi:hypothetical protein